MSEIERLFKLLLDHDVKLKNSFSLIPSENIISPVARLAFLSDAYIRYFFDEKEILGQWIFQGGSIIGDIQNQLLRPLFQSVAKAKYVDFHSISGLSGMTLVLAALGGEAGSAVFSVSTDMGGHPDTKYLAQKFGLNLHYLPKLDWATLDLDKLAAMVERENPTLIYIDQATTLFPFDLKPIIQTIREASSRHVHVHVDSSHVNGLIWGGHLPNPLECGADSYGGSTHKTFPGPHKAVLFTNSPEVAERITLAAINIISHTHMSEVIALAITLLEFIECGGQEYTQQIVKNAKAFAQALYGQGFDVQGKECGFTNNHQVWFDSSSHLPASEVATVLFNAGFIVNPYNPLPSLSGPGIRMGVNESTRLGLKEEHMQVLAEYFRKALSEQKSVESVAKKVADFRKEFKPQFCYDANIFREKLLQLSAPFKTKGCGDLDSLVSFLYR